MIKKLLLSVIVFSILGIFSCKSEFEKTRQEGSAEERLALARKYLEAEQCYKAQTLFESVIGAYRGTQEQEGIYFDYAQSMYCQGSYLKSSHYFRDFSSTYPNSKLREEANYMVAYSFYKMSPEYKLDQTYTSKAIDEFQLFINTHPSSERVSECNKLIDECRVKLEKKAYAEGQLYYDLKNYEAATVSFQNLLKDYPESPNAEKVRYLIAKASYQWASKSILSKQKERFEAANDYAQVFLARHSSSEYTNQVKDILEDSTIKLKEINE